MLGVLVTVFWSNNSSEDGVQESRAIAPVDLPHTWRISMLHSVVAALMVCGPSMLQVHATLAAQALWLLGMFSGNHCR